MEESSGLNTGNIGESQWSPRPSERKSVLGRSYPFDFTGKF